MLGGLVGAARLFAFLKIDLFILKVDLEFDIVEPPIVLLDFEIPFDRPPKLATEMEGILQINAGEFAAQRLNGNVSDDRREIRATMTGPGFSGLADLQIVLTRMEPF